MRSSDHGKPNLYLLILNQPKIDFLDKFIPILPPNLLEKFKKSKL